MTNILLLDDSPEVQKMTKTLLEWEGHKVICLNNGKEGLHFMQRSKTLPDVVLCDMQMPEMDGLTFLRSVRSKTQWARVRIIIMSAENNDIDAARQSGANGYMLKPLDVDKFQRVLQKWGLLA